MKSMMCRPRTDELVSSLWMRCAKRAMVPLRLLMQVVLEPAGASLGFLSCANLRVLSECLAMPADSLLYEHTPFPFFTSGRQPSDVAKVAEKVLDGKPAFGKSRMIAHIGPRQWCTRCTEEDVRRFGDSHWRVSHNLPGVTVCLTHRIPLVCSQDWESESRAAFVSSLPHELANARPVIESVTPFLSMLTRIAIQRQTSSQEVRESRGHEWTKQRLEERGFKLTGKLRVYKELLVTLQRCLGTAGEAVVRSDIESFIRQVVRIPYQRVESQQPRHRLRYLVFQALLELDARDAAQHIPTDVVSSSVNKDGVSVFDAPRAKLAKAFIDARIKQEEPTTVTEVLHHCGMAKGHYRKHYPRLRAQIERLLTSEATRRRNNELSDAERARIARDFIDERVKAGTRTYVAEVRQACGMHFAVTAKANPLLRREIESFKDLDIAVLQTPSLRDPQLAATARKFVDERVKSGTRTTTFDVLAACEISYSSLKKYPLLSAEMSRFRTLPISARRPFHA
jgi:hypothetical protein